jgi:hypothetical protein
VTLEQLQAWITSPEGMQPQLTLLSRYAAAKSVGLDLLATDLAVHAPDWHRLLFAASILTKSTDAAHNETALMIASTPPRRKSPMRAPPSWHSLRTTEQSHLPKAEGSSRNTSKTA